MQQFKQEIGGQRGRKCATAEPAAQQHSRQALQHTEPGTPVRLLPLCSIACGTPYPSVPIAMAHCHTRRRASYTTPGARHRIVVYGAGRPASYGRIRCRAPGVVWLHTVPGARRRIRSSLELLLQYYFVLSGFEMESSKSWWWPQDLGFLHSSFFLSLARGYLNRLPGKLILCFYWQRSIWIFLLASWGFLIGGHGDINWGCTSTMQGISPNLLGEMDFRWKVVRGHCFWWWKKFGAHTLQPFFVSFGKRLS